MHRRRRVRLTCDDLTLIPAVPKVSFTAILVPLVAVVFELSQEVNPSAVVAVPAVVLLALIKVAIPAERVPKP